MTSSSMLRSLGIACLIVVIGFFPLEITPVCSQTSSGGAGTGSGGLGVGTLTPFVTSVIPIVGPNGGVVGGISIDPDGTVLRAEPKTSRKLGQVRAKAIGNAEQHSQQSSKLRKISLRKLDQELVRLRKSELPLTEEMEFLAGLQRIEYIFVDPEANDIILAGPAEGWEANDMGFIVGTKSKRPVIELSDLLIALRSEVDQSARGITCSMDATETGLARYNQFMRSSRPKFNKQTLRQMKNAIGNFEVSFQGVDATSHFARVLIAADLMMKRMAMNLEKSPVRGIQSYVKLLQTSKAPAQKNAMPRWWLALDYEPLSRDETGLAWKIRGPAVKAMSDQDFLDQNGQKVSANEVNPLAQQWADNFTNHYDELSVASPVFGQLRNCMDLTVVAAILTKYQIFEKSGFEPVLLLNKEKLRLAKYDVPKYTPPQVSYAKRGRAWLVTLSGGIDMDGWTVAENHLLDSKINQTRRKVIESATNRWWWD